MIGKENKLRRNSQEDNKEKYHPVMPVSYTYSSSFMLLGAAGDTTLWEVFQFKPLSLFFILCILMDDKY